MAEVDFSPVISPEIGGALRKPLLLLREHSSGSFRNLSPMAKEKLEVWLQECAVRKELPGKEDGELERRLNATELTLLGIGACIGAGIFVLTGAEARLAGPSVALAFVLAAASSIFNGFCYAELASRLPVSGSAYLYAYCLLGELAALVLVANQLVDYHIGAATLTRSLVSYFSQGLVEMGVPIHPCITGCQLESAPWLNISLGAPIVLGLVTFVVARGAETNALVTSIMTVLKVAIVVFVISLGFQRLDTSRWTPFFPNGFSATLQTAATLNYAFIGYDVIANAAEETANPQRDIPVAIMSALLVCATLYCSLALVLCGMQQFYTIDTEAPVSSAFLQQGMVWVASVVDVGSCVGMITGLLAGLYGQSRIYFAIARDQMIPSILHKTKFSSIWCGLLAAILATLFDVRCLASFLNIGVLLSYAMTAASVLLINACDRRSENRFLALAVLATFGLALGQGFWAPPGLAIGSGTVLLGLLSWAALQRGYACGPESTFHCPGLPVMPLAALACNVYLAAELSWHAWARFVVIAALVVIVHSIATAMGAIDHVANKKRVCDTVKSVAAKSSTKTGLCRTSS